MSDDMREPIIDSLLEELLGGQQPPDLKKRVLAAHAKPTNGEKESDNTKGQLHKVTHPDDRTVLPPPVAAPKHKTITTAPKVTPVPRAVTYRRRSSWRGPVMVALVFISASIILVWALNNADGPINVAQVRPHDIADHALATDGSSIPPSLPPEEERDEDDQAAVFADTDDRPGPVDPSPNPPDEPTPDTNRDHPPSSPDIRLARSDEEIVDFIDEQLEAHWIAAGLDETRSVSDLVWCQRVFLQLFGRQPNAAEVRRFVNERDRQKRANLVKALLASEETISQFADHWGGVLATMLVGDGPKENIDRAELERYLRGWLFADKPYDQLVYELVTAEGSNKPGQANFNGATNFLLAFQNERKTSATDQVCRVLLGRRMQCAQCHDHPLDQWRQEQYWQFASFFMQMQATPLENNGGMRLVNRDYLGESGTPKEAEVFYVDPDELNRVAYPRHLDGTAARSHSGLIADIDRRQELASKLVKSDKISQAFVNRVWNQIFGIGFTYPVDDMGTHNQPSHPQLLKGLASEFQGRDYSIQDLVRWMVLSKAFDRPPANNLLAGFTSRFSSFQENRTVPVGNVGNSLSGLAKARRDGRPFEIFGQENGKNEKRDQSAVARIDAKRLLPLLSDASGGLLHRLAKSSLSDEDVISHLFMATLARKPNPRELADARSILAAGPRLPALRDIGATLLLSREFVNEH